MGEFILPRAYGLSGKRFLGQRPLPVSSGADVPFAINNWTPTTAGAPFAASCGGGWTGAYAVATGNASGGDEGTFIPSPVVVSSQDLVCCCDIGSLPSAIDPMGNPGVMVALTGTVSQNIFTSLVFTDVNNLVETYLTASALGFSTTLAPGYSTWFWHPFDPSNQFPISSLAFSPQPTPFTVHL